MPIYTFEKLAWYDSPALNLGFLDVVVPVFVSVVFVLPIGWIRRYRGDQTQVPSIAVYLQLDLVAVLNLAFLIGMYLELANPRSPSGTLHGYARCSCCRWFRQFSALWASPARWLRGVSVCGPCPSGCTTASESWPRSGSWCCWITGTYSGSTSNGEEVLMGRSIRFAGGREPPAPQLDDPGIRSHM
jgi:hypothetical protein